MTDNSTDQQQRRRFFRDGAPYIDNFETIASLLMGKQKQQDLFINTTLELIRSIHEHLAQCQDMLGKTESLVETARAEDAPKEKVNFTTA